MSTALAAAADVSNSYPAVEAPSHNRFYAAFHGGALFPGITTDIIPEYDDLVVKTSGKTGYRVGGAIGFMFNPYLAVEGDLSYSSADPNKIDGFLGPATVTGSSSVITAMANVLVGVPIGRWRPYVGGGIGIAYFTASNVEAKPYGPLDGSDTGLALQGIAGIDFALNDRVSFGGRYSYMRLSDISIPDPLGFVNNITTDFHSVEAVLTLRLGN